MTKGDKVKLSEKGLNRFRGWPRFDTFLRGEVLSLSNGLIKVELPSNVRAEPQFFRPNLWELT